MAEREGFEPSREIAPPYRFSKPTPSATWVPLQKRDKPTVSVEQDNYNRYSENSLLDFSSRYLRS
jgi:hypothetical protein